MGGSGGRGGGGVRGLAEVGRRCPVRGEALRVAGASYSARRGAWQMRGVRW